MFDIGFWELLVIGVIALLVIGPERLPSFLRSTADTVGQVKRMANGFKEEISAQLKTHELHENLKKAEQIGIDSIGGDIKKSIDELKAAAESVQRPYSESSNTTDTSHSADTSEAVDKTHANENTDNQIKPTENKNK